MAQNPKDNLEKIKRILNAWETLAPTKSFGGMTLAQFKTTAQPSLDTRDLIDDLEAQLAQAKARRDAADDESLDSCKRAANGVLADPTEGEDSALYQEMGYTRKSDRKSGLTRKGKKKPTE